MTDLRVAVLTPLTPQRSGIAEYCAALLPAVAQHDFAVTVVVDDSVVDSVAPLAGGNVVALADYTSRRDDWDVAAYHMGNNCEFHLWIYRELLQRPGLTVLHDLDLSGFYSNLEALAPDLPGSTTKGLGSLATVVECSRAVVVHTQPQAELVARRYPAATVLAGELAGVPSGAAPAEVAAVLQACGWNSEHFVVGALGGIARHKRTDLAVRAFAAVATHEPSLRLLIAGWVFESEFLLELQELVESLGIGDIVRIVTDRDDLSSCVLAVDVVLDTRADVSGAMSAVTMNSLASGRPVIVPDFAMYRQFDVHGLMRTGQSVTDVVVLATKFLRQCVKDRLATRRSGEAAAQWIADGDCSVAAVAARHAEHLRQAHALADPPPSLVPVIRPTPVRRDIVGELTVVGDLTATTGLMEFCRSLANVLDEAGFRLDHFHNPCDGATHSDARDVRSLAKRLPRRRDSPIELWLPNINEFVNIPQAILRPPDEPRRKIIAVWAWELPVLRSPFVEQIARVDEIWVNSPFVARIVKRYTRVPVTVIPAPMQVNVPDGFSRRHFGFNDNDVIFYFDFDGNSTAARKNPFALIQAFRRAFADGTADTANLGVPRLVIKGTNFHVPIHHQLGRDLRNHLASIGGVFLEAEFDRGELNALLSCIDVYASMHRSEGLGLGMLEAMYLGKPVISPAYPQKWLFSLAEVGCAVRAPLRRISEADHSYFPAAVGVYSTDDHWTEPDVADAARWIRLLYDDPALRLRLGQQAGRLMRQYYSPAAALAAMEPRLAAIADQVEREGLSAMEPARG